MIFNCERQPGTTAVSTTLRKLVCTHAAASFARDVYEQIAAAASATC
jgi:hypothetical protein